MYSSSESRLVASRKVCGRVLSLAWGRDNSLYVGSEAGTVARLRVAAAEAEAEVLALPSLHTPVHCLAVRATTLAAASRTIVVWDLATEAVIKTLTGHSSPVTSLHFDPAGSVLLSRYNMRIWITSSSDSQICLSSAAATRELSACGIWRRRRRPTPSPTWW